MASYRLPKIIKKSFNNYSEEAKAELEELSKLNIMAANGSTKKQEVQVSIDKPEAIEVRIYDLSNFSKNYYFNFNRSVKKLAD